MRQVGGGYYEGSLLMPPAFGGSDGRPPHQTQLNRGPYGRFSAPWQIGRESKFVNGAVMRPWGRAVGAVEPTGTAMRYRAPFGHTLTCHSFVPQSPSQGHSLPAPSSFQAPAPLRCARGAPRFGIPGGQRVGGGCGPRGPISKTTGSPVRNRCVCASGGHALHTQSKRAGAHLR